MTKYSSQAGSSRQKQSPIRRITRSMGKKQQVQPSNKEGKSSMAKNDLKAKAAAVDDTMWIQTTYWYKSLRRWESEKGAKEEAPPKKEEMKEFIHTEYPKFPADYFNLEVEDDGREQYIELRGNNTICPGSPGYLPERVPVQKWFQEIMWGKDDWKPYQNMVRYSELTSDLRVQVDDRKKHVKEQESKMNWITKVKWYFNFLK